ncbi:MAG: hypothetical protein V7603_1977 [Micromonosporaceae bacterium]
MILGDAMNNSLDPATPPLVADRPAPRVGADQLRRSRVVALLVGAAPVAAAVVALGAAPLAAAIPIGVPPAAARTGAVLAGGDPCMTTITVGALSTVKAPNCAGD